MDRDLCPCCSQINYGSCCKPFHDGMEPQNPLALMRSRYCAYALDIPDYIQKTTHPKSPHFESNKKKWIESIQQFSRTTKFIKLEIYDSGHNWVHFCAHLEQEGHPVQLIEKSLFDQVNGHWKYIRSIL